MEQDNLTAKQSDYALFLPAISSFYSTYIGKQRYEEYVPKTRMPAALANGMESLNFFNKKEGAFPYKWALYSAGHAKLELDFAAKEDMIRNRDPDTILVGDSGGFQIGKGVWEGDWKNPACPKAQKKRELVLAWMDAYMDYGMILDIPAWVARSPKGAEATGISTYEDAVFATEINNNYFMANRTGRCKFLNVLQGENHTEADDWYERMKKYNDPALYPDTHFNGWSMGGQNMCDIHLILRRIITIIYDGLLVEGKHDWMHFLGTSKLEWATLLTDVQRAIRKYHNPSMIISFDCASPFLAVANGQVYMDVETEDRKKWVYRMQPTADDKAYATDNRLFRDAVLQDGIHKSFLDSPVTKNLKVNDICIYKDGVRKSTAELNGEEFDVTNLNHYSSPPDLNKIGKVGKTSWDSFSYALLMGHNVWSHINAVQSANRAYDAGNYPNMLIQEQFTRITIRDLIDSIFAAPTKAEAMAIIEDKTSMQMWKRIIGTRGASGKKAVGPGTFFNKLFEEVKPDNEPAETEELDETKLDDLEINN